MCGEGSRPGAWVGAGRAMNDLGGLVGNEMAAA
eukprot:COSAG06_NODE_29476_length_555_cov_2.712719_1_plen_32_part_10